LNLYNTPLGQEVVMDDDLRALLGGMDDDEEEDDLLGAFADPTGGAANDDLALPDWMEAGLAEQPASSPPPASPASAPGHLTDEGDRPDWLAATTTGSDTLPGAQPASAPLPEPEPSTPAGAGGRPEWLAELDPGLGAVGEEEPVDQPRSRRSRRKRAASSSKPRALTPRQRMLLSIFLFLDIAVLGCFLLLAIGAISF
jgi:hypothetical protein